MELGLIKPRMVWLSGTDEFQNGTLTGPSERHSTCADEILIVHDAVCFVTTFSFTF